MAVWYGLFPYGMLLPFWYVWTMKNLATLLSTILRHSTFVAIRCYSISKNLDFKI
jgi:hypothetical protein